jgi:hypothetical protein
MESSKGEVEEEERSRTRWLKMVVMSCETSPPLDDDDDDDDDDDRSCFSALLVFFFSFGGIYGWKTNLISQ